MSHRTFTTPPRAAAMALPMCLTTMRAMAKRITAMRGTSRGGDVVSDP